MTISAKIIADSISENGHRITTFELEYPRFIHAEFMTHRLFSRNAASSRAIPVATQIKLIKEQPAEPVHWGKNQPGMSAKEELDDVTKTGAINQWHKFANDAAFASESLMNIGVHKQIANRIMEPFAHIKVVCTATEYDNFFYLRCHPDAQPEIQRLAELMYEAYTKSEPKLLQPGEWHVPYFRDGFWTPNNDDDTLEDALAVSASCCAQVSYRKLDDSIEKARDIYARLVESKPVHASPFEHQGTPMQEQYFCDDEQVLLHCNTDNGTLDAEGITHFDRRGYAWSGNLRGWIQHRQLIAGNTCYVFKP